MTLETFKLRVALKWIRNGTAKINMSNEYAGILAAG